MTDPFDYADLPQGKVRDIAAVVASVAEDVRRNIPDGPDQRLGLGALLVARAHFIRALEEGE